MAARSRYPIAAMGMTYRHDAAWHGAIWGSGPKSDSNLSNPAAKAMLPNANNANNVYIPNNAPNLTFTQSQNGKSYKYVASNVNGTYSITRNGAAWVTLKLDKATGQYVLTDPTGTGRR